MQSLTFFTRRKQARTCLNRMKKKPPALICIQEHKLQSGQEHHSTEASVEGRLFIAAQAVDGVHTAKNEHVIGEEGGVALQIHRSLERFITREGVLDNKLGV
jgi:hypothetical protein